MPRTSEALMGCSWSDIEPLYRDLERRSISAENVTGFLGDWTTVSETVDEIQSRLYVATTQNTGDEDAARRHQAFLDDIYPLSEEAEQRVRRHFLASGFAPPGSEVARRQMQASADLFREVNVPLSAQEQKLESEYDRIIGAQTVLWQGEEVPLPALGLAYRDPDRSTRERAWCLSAERRLQDRDAINALWMRFLRLRTTLADNAGLADYRTFRWQQLLRLDYSPQDTLAFHRAIEEIVVPAATRIYEQRRQKLGVERLRPWDLQVDVESRPPLRPFRDVGGLVTGVHRMFHQVDGQLGGFFDTMIEESLLDLDNRKNKAPGGYQIDFAASGVPFIFMNAVGVHDDVTTLLHEGGHAFHTFLTRPLPWHPQKHTGHEFSEVASMAMELLAAPYLPASRGGFYTPEEARRARLEHLEDIILFWPRMAIIDAFQHWVYTHPGSALDPTACDAMYMTLYRKFVPGVDWGGLEHVLAVEWHQIPHIHEVPFYYVEYGMAQLGAVQVWEHALRDQSAAVAQYKSALSLGNTRPLPLLFAAAGARFQFTGETLSPAIALLEGEIDRLHTN